MTAPARKGVATVAVTGTGMADASFRPLPRRATPRRRPAAQAPGVGRRGRHRAVVRGRHARSRRIPSGWPCPAARSSCSAPARKWARCPCRRAGAPGSSPSTSPAWHLGAGARGGAAQRGNAAGPGRRGRRGPRAARRPRPDRRCPGGGRLARRLEKGRWCSATTSTRTARTTSCVCSAVDALTVRLQAERPDVALAFLATPTDVFAVPAHAVAQSARAYARRSPAAKLGRWPLQALSGGRVLRRAYPPAR